ncbi:hypothetical protein Fmac_009346 [Flemingia macrophylla]|uniref:Uncharacterized protein n=1 Tax=Flemingia macrophylla TaxID=520843 RepID=A0ABD1MZZ9_9FABA
MNWKGSSKFLTAHRHIRQYHLTSLGRAPPRPSPRGRLAPGRTPAPSHAYMRERSHAGTRMPRNARPQPPPPPQNHTARPKRPVFKVLPGPIAFCLVCHTSIVDGLIRSSDSIVSQLRRDTGCKIHYEDSVAAIEDRIILVIGSLSPHCPLELVDGHVDVSNTQKAVVRVFESDDIEVARIACWSWWSLGRGEGTIEIEELRKLVLQAESNDGSDEKGISIREALKRKAEAIPPPVASDIPRPKKLKIQRRARPAPKFVASRVIVTANEPVEPPQVQVPVQVSMSASGERLPPPASPRPSKFKIEARPPPVPLDQPDAIEMAIPEADLQIVSTSGPASDAITSEDGVLIIPDSPRPFVLTQAQVEELPPLNLLALRKRRSTILADKAASAPPVSTTTSSSAPPSRHPKLPAVFPDSQNIYDVIFPGTANPDTGYELLKYGVNRSMDRDVWKSNRIGKTLKPRSDITDKSISVLCELYPIDWPGRYIFQIPGRRKMDFYAPICSWLPNGIPVVDEQGNPVLDSEGQPTYKDLPTSARATYGSEYYANPSAPTLLIPGQKGYVPPVEPPVHLLYEPPELSVKPRTKVPYTTEWRLKYITNTKSVEYTVDELEEQFRQLMTKAELDIKYHLLLESDNAASEVAASESEPVAYEDAPSDEVPTSAILSSSHTEVVPYLYKPYIPHMSHVASAAYRALPPNVILTDPFPIIQRPIYSTKVIKSTRPWRPPPGTPRIEMPLHEVEDFSQVDPYSTPLQATVSQITLCLPSLRLSPVPLDPTSLPYLTAKKHQLINHLQLCPSMPHQHTIPPSLWLGPESSIRISLDRVCPRLPPANNNKLKGKKIYRGPMPAPSKMCIKSFPDMTHSRVQKKMHNTEFLESNAEKYYHQFMHECTKGASTSGIPIEENGKILVIKGKSKVHPCSLVHFSDTSIAFTRKNPRPILGPETSIIYLIASVLLNMEAYQKEWKEVTDSWPKALVDWWCQHISPWKPGDPIPSKEGFEPPSREPSPPPVPESDLQVAASDTPQPMAVMPIAASEPASTAPVPTDFVTRAEFEELKALIHSRLPPAPAPAPLPPPPPPPAADTVSRTEFLAFQNQMSSEFQCLLAFWKQNLPPPPPPPRQE